jgi:hypothetical protein
MDKEYWVLCIESALDEIDVVLSKDVIVHLAECAQLGAEHIGSYTGNVPDKPHGKTEVEKLRRQISDIVKIRGKGALLMSRVLIERSNKVLSRNDVELVAMLEMAELREQCLREKFEVLAEALTRMTVIIANLDCEKGMSEFEFQLQQRGVI